MAAAKKCDRCGDYYDDNVIKVKTGYIVEGISIHFTDHCVGSRGLDLCGDCVKEFFKFIYGEPGWKKELGRKEKK